MMCDEAVTAMDRVPGWLSKVEARLLYETARVAVSGLPGDVVEVGSYLGRSTVLLGLAARAGRPGARVHAVDPHEGVVPDPVTGLKRVDPTWWLFLDNVRKAGVEVEIRPVRLRSCDVVWSRPIALLFVDGLHDYASVRADYGIFGPSVPAGGYIAFHDYGNPDFPDVRRFVDERVLAGELAVYEFPVPLCRENSLIVTRRR